MGAGVLGPEQQYATACMPADNWLAMCPSLASDHKPDLAGRQEAAPAEGSAPTLVHASDSSMGLVVASSAPNALRFASEIIYCCTLWTVQVGKIAAVLRCPAALLVPGWPWLPQYGVLYRQQEV